MMDQLFFSIGQYDISLSQIMLTERDNHIFKCTSKIDQGLQQIYFVKELVINNNNEQQVQQEVQVYQKLKEIEFNNIIEIEDIICQDKIYYIIMEQYQQTLQDRIMVRRQNNQPFQTKEILDMFWQILQGYKCLQQAKIVHNNISSENILFKDGIYKIFNFSRAQYLDTYEIDDQDMFNLGCILYEMASLKPLFQAFTQVDKRLSQQVFRNNTINNQIKINQITLSDSKELCQLIQQLLTLCIVEHNRTLSDLESKFKSKYDNTKSQQLIQFHPDEKLDQYFIEPEKYQRYTDHDIQICLERNNLNLNSIEDKFKLFYLFQIGYLYLQERQLTQYNSSYWKSVQSSDMFYYWFLMRILFIHVILSIANASIQLLEGSIIKKEIYLAVDEEELNRYLSIKMNAPSTQRTKNTKSTTQTNENEGNASFFFYPLTDFEDILYKHLNKIKECLQQQLEESFRIINKGIKPIQTKCTLLILKEIGARNLMETNQVIFFIRELYNEKKEYFQQFHYDRYIKQVIDLNNKYQMEENSIVELDQIIKDLKQSQTPQQLNN